MIKFMNCSDVDMDSIHSAFVTGFSDYMLDMNIKKDIFPAIFFGREGNSLHTSFIALGENGPIGLILGGIKEYEGIKTMRCGGLCVAPAHRRMGIAQKLFELHKQEAVSNGCKRLFLEVIAENHKAINFYDKQGYIKIYDLNYYALGDTGTLKDKIDSQVQIREIGMEKLREIRNGIRDVHINWQNDIDFLEKADGQINFGAFTDGDLAGVISINKSSRLSFIWVDYNFRGQGIGTGLMASSARSLQLDKISVSFPNNASLYGFAERTGFAPSSLTLYEMYCRL